MPRQPAHPSEPVKGGSGYKPVNKWVSPEGEGWQHGDIPPCPDDLHDDTEEAWRVWFSSWWAGLWTPDVVPTLNLIAKLYDAAMHGVTIYDQKTGLPRTLDVGDIGKLTQLMDKFGMTPYGRKQLLWTRTETEVEDSAKESAQDEIARRREARRARGIG